MILAWDWVAFGIGTFGAFLLEFSRFLRQNKTLTEVIIVGKSKINTTNFNYFALFMTLAFVVIGGAVAALFATTKNEAILYGGLWQALFTYVIRINDRG